MNRKIIGLISATALFVSASITPAAAGTATTTLGVSLTITAGCTVSSSPVAFAGQSVLAAAVTATGTVTVTCTNTTTYTVALDQGAGTGATVTTRTMQGPASATISYGLYRDGAWSQNWGKTAGTDTASGTGNGSAQNITVYGKVPAQTSPAAGSYADTVNVTVNF
jgi:spore coat protein U-like protein